LLGGYRVRHSQTKGQIQLQPMTNQALQRLQRAAWSTPKGKVSVSARDLSALIYAWAKLQERDQAIGFKPAISKPNLTGEFDP
jgi:hypothetical protein